MDANQVENNRPTSEFVGGRCSFGGFGYAPPREVAEPTRQCRI